MAPLQVVPPSYLKPQHSAGRQRGVVELGCCHLGLFDRRAAACLSVDGDLTWHGGDGRRSQMEVQDPAFGPNPVSLARIF